MRYTKSTYGNPYWLSQILVDTVDGEIPDKISRELDRRLDRAYADVPGAQEILRYAAVLGRRFNMLTLSKLMDMDIDRDVWCTQSTGKIRLGKKPQQS